jgi:hypothetical protein
VTLMMAAHRGYHHIIAKTIGQHPIESIGEEENIKDEDWMDVDHCEGEQTMIGGCDLCITDRHALVLGPFVNTVKLPIQQQKHIFTCPCFF